MKKNSNSGGEIGVVFLAIGGALLFYAWNMDVTVYYQGSDIVNFAKMDSRRNYMLMGALAFALGVFLVIISGRGSSANELPKKPVPDEPPCQRDLSFAAYKIWLVEKYEIAKNQVLGSFVCQEKLFSTVESAMEYAHDIELSKMKEREEEKQKEEVERRDREEREEVERRKTKLIIDFFVGSFRDLMSSLWGFFKNYKKTGYVFCSVAVILSGFIFGENILRNRYENAQSKYTDAYWEFEAGNDEWRKARILVGRRLEVAEIAKVEVVLVGIPDGSGHYAKIINRSNYFLRNIEGHLKLFSSDIQFPGNSIAFFCCRSSVAPGQEFIQQDVIAIDGSWSEIGKTNFAKLNQIRLEKGKDGRLEYPLDSRTAFEGSMDFYAAVAFGGSKSEEHKVDFQAQAERSPEVSVYYDSEAAKLLDTRRRELGDADAALESWRQFLGQLHVR